MHRLIRLAAHARMMKLRQFCCQGFSPIVPQTTMQRSNLLTLSESAIGQYRGWKSRRTRIRGTLFFHVVPNFDKANKSSRRVSIQFIFCLAALDEYRHHFSSAEQGVAA